MKKDPIFSVIIPAYNHEKYIGDCVQSVLDQTYNNFEIIIINDGSVDKTEEVIRGFSDTRIKYFYQENHDAPYTINRGMKMAKGKYIAILNSDDVFEKNKLEESLKVLSQECQFVFGKLRVIDENGNALAEEDARVGWINDKLNNFDGADLLKKLLLNINFIVTTSNFVFEKSVLEKIGYFHEKLHYSHDFDFLLRVVGEDIKIEFIPQFLSSYRMHSDNTISKGKSEAILEASYAISKLIANGKFPTDLIGENFYRNPIFCTTVSSLFSISDEDKESVVRDKDNYIRNKILENISYWTYWDRDFSEIYKELTLLKNELDAIKSTKLWKFRKVCIKIKNYVF